MDASVFTQILLPIAIVLIMFGMGLSLTVNDFTRLTKKPKAIGVGLFGQIILMPILAYLLCIGLGLSQPLAIGLMILAACPGGTMSNIFSQLAKANLALSVSLTGISTLICVVSTPFIIQFALNSFGEAKAADISLVKTALGLFVVTLVPVFIGIFLRYQFPQKALQTEGFFRKFSLTFMIMMITVLVISERELLADSFKQVFLACLLLNIISMLIGLVLGKISGLALTDSVTLSLEVGIQNATLAILIAVSFLDAPELAITAGVYGLAMYIGPSLLLIFLKYFAKNKNKVLAYK